MTMGGSLFLIALGAILYFAIEANIQGINVDMIGVILMVIGAVGMILSALFWSSFAPFGSSRREVHTTDAHVH